MPSVVVDASAIVNLYLGNAAAVRVASTMAGSAVVAPAHLDAEVLSTLGRLVRARVIDGKRVVPVLEHFARSRIIRVPLVPLLVDAWRLGSNISMSDAPYVVLARRIGATLLTSDVRLARAPTIGVPVVVATT